MNKQEVIDYVMNTPHNVNRTILSQSLDEIGTQANWNQNDPTKADYVKNRTHYTEVKEAVYDVSADGKNTAQTTEEITKAFFDNWENATFTTEDGLVIAIADCEISSLENIKTAMLGELHLGIMLTSHFLTANKPGIFNLTLREEVVHKLPGEYVEEMYYTEPDTLTAMVKEENLVFEANDSGKYVCYVEDYVYADGPSLIDLMNNEEQILVRWDGTEYWCSCYDSGEAFYAEAEPFTIEANPYYADSGLTITANDTTANHRVGIYYVLAGELHKIPEKYIPTSENLLKSSGFAYATDRGVSSTATYEMINLRLGKNFKPVPGGMISFYFTRAQDWNPTRETTKISNVDTEDLYFFVNPDGTKITTLTTKTTHLAVCKDEETFVLLF